MSEPRKAIRWLREQWSKQSGHNLVFDGRDDIGEDSENWTSDESFSDTLVEAYADSELEVRVQVVAGHGPANAHRYLAVYRSIGDEDATRKAVRRLVSGPRINAGIHGTDSDKQVSVLVNIVKVAEVSQPAAYIPSLVRLYILDDPIGLHAGTGERGHLSPPPFPSLPWWTIMDREERLIARHLLVEHDELIRKMIKSAAEIVYAIPEDQLGGWIKNGWVLPPVQVLSSILPYFTLEGLGVKIRDGTDNLFQLVSVGFGSTDLVTDPIQGRLLAAFHGLLLESDVRETGRPGADAGDTGGSHDPGPDASGCAP